MGNRCFFHFGIRTFFEGASDWDGTIMPESAFDPYLLNCRKWIETACKGGAKYAILTCKHHDGFANWPSKYTEYSVKNSPWKNGNGDVVREFTDACREYGLKVGLYYSPAQVGYKFSEPKEYDDYFINQISELLTNYGKIDYLWFDGCGSEEHVYDVDRIIAIVRSLQPNMLIFSMWDPDTSWIGNEEGIVPFGSKYVVNSAKTSINQSEAKWLDKARFLPYECDCKIRRDNWFYSEYDSYLLRSVDDLTSLYEYSVGRGGNLLINIAPDRRGLLPETDSQRFIEFGNAIRERFSNPLYSLKNVNKKRIDIEFENAMSVNCVVLQENLLNGQSIGSFKISLVVETEICLFEGKTIGHKQICRFPEIYGKSFRIEITDNIDAFKLDRIEFFKI